MVCEKKTPCDSLSRETIRLHSGELRRTGKLCRRPKTLGPPP